MLRNLVLAIVLTSSVAANPAVAHVMLVSETCPGTDFTKLQKSVVSISFMYQRPDKNGHVGQRGTAWFLNNTHLATVGHVTDNALDADWREATISYGTTVRQPATEHVSVHVRLAKVIDVGLPEKISLIELAAPLPGFVPAKVRFEPLAKDEPVVGVGYRGTEMTLQYGVGHFSIPESTSEPDPKAKPLEPYLYFELSNELGEDRYVFDRGASGSPVFDCHGQVVAILNSIKTQSINQTESLQGMISSLQRLQKTLPNAQLEHPIHSLHRLTSAWGQPNYTGVHVSRLPE